MKISIGISTLSDTLVNASFTKFAKTNIKGNKLSRLSLNYNHETSELVSFEFSFYNYLEMRVIIPDQEYFGIQFGIHEKSKITYVSLDLFQDEEIYHIDGCFNEVTNTIQKLSIFTTYSRFIEVGPKMTSSISSTTKNNSELIFSWDFYYNNKIFDGFLIGYNTSINYLSILYFEMDFTVYSDYHYLKVNDENDNTILRTQSSLKFKEKEAELQDVSYSLVIDFENKINPVVISAD